MSDRPEAIVVDETPIIFHSTLDMPSRQALLFPLLLPVPITTAPGTAQPSAMSARGTPRVWGGMAIRVCVYTCCIVCTYCGTQHAKQSPQPSVRGAACMQLWPGCGKLTGWTLADCEWHAAAPGLKPLHLPRAPGWCATATCPWPWLHPCRASKHRTERQLVG